MSDDDKDTREFYARPTGMTSACTPPSSRRCPTIPARSPTYCTDWSSTST